MATDSVVAHAGWLIRSAGRELLIPLPSFVVGRGTNAQLRLEDAGVSRRHACFRVDPFVQRGCLADEAAARGVAAVVDLGSSNGTFVNGRRIAGPTVVGAGDRVELGSCRLDLIDVPVGAVFEEHVTRQVARTAEYERVAPASDTLGPDALGPLEELSPRERELFSFLVRGLPQREVAERLGVSIKTVQTHRTRIGQKLGARSRADLIGVALQVGVLKPGANSLRWGGAAPAAPCSEERTNQGAVRGSPDVVARRSR